MKEERRAHTNRASMNVRMVYPISLNKGIRGIGEELNGKNDPTLKKKSDGREGGKNQAALESPGGEDRRIHGIGKELTFLFVGSRRLR